MQVLKHTFKNNGLGTYNDDSLERLYDLKDNNYRINIIPDKSTTYWRLGIRLSKTQSIEFFHPFSRYKKPEYDKYIDIHVGVGEWDGKEWSLPHRIHLAQYNLIADSNQHILNRADDYISYEEIEWEIAYARRFKKLSLRIFYADEKSFESTYALDDDFRYFKIFAWSDQNAFKIDAEIAITERYFSKSVAISPKHKVSTNSFYITDRFSPVLGVIEIAKEIGELLKRLLDQKGNMFGIFGQWGRGKTFLWQEISKYLNTKEENSPNFLRVEFHAWKYQDTPASWAYLYEIFADKYFDTNYYKSYKHGREQEKAQNARSFWSKYFGWIKGIIAICKDRKTIISKKIHLNAVRFGVEPIIYFVFGFLLFVIWLFIPIEKKLKWGTYLVSIFGLIVVLKVLYLYFVYKPKAKNVLNRYTDKISFQKYLGLQAEIQKEIVFLFKAWIPPNKIPERKILLFVDDIDRCDESRVIQVVDSLKVMLEDVEISKRLIILAALDERVLKMAINEKYRKIVFENSDGGKQEKYNMLLKLTKEYIDKIFLSGIKLGHLSKYEIGEVFDAVTEGRISSKNFEKVDVIEVEETESFKEKSIHSLQDYDMIENVASQESVMIEEDDQYDIGQTEYKFLKEALAYFDDPTPRIIRIYYYRYMLAKNILKHKIGGNSPLYDAWLTGDKKILAFLIVYYSSDLNSLKIRDDCINTLNNSDEAFKLSIFNIPFRVDRSLYLELLKIIEMVVPY